MAAVLGMASRARARGQRVAATSMRRSARMRALGARQLDQSAAIRRQRRRLAEARRRQIVLSRQHEKGRGEAGRETILFGLQLHLRGLAGRARHLDAGRRRCRAR